MARKKQPTVQQLAGERSWHKRLLDAGDQERAKAYAALHPHVLGGAQDGATAGGEGVGLAAPAGKFDRNTPAPVNLQCDAVARAGNEQAMQEQLPSPRGELEGESEISQANGGEHSVKWPEQAVGVVRGLCRNARVCRVEMEDGRLATLEKSGYGLFNGEKVKVGRVWVSGDGRDATYEVVGRVPLPEQEAFKDVQMTVSPVGFAGQCMTYPARVDDGVPSVVDLNVLRAEARAMAEKERN